MNGLAATAAIREREAGTGGHLLIVAMTAHPMAGDRERCLAAGMDAYVAKPINVSELVGVIDQILKMTSQNANIDICLLERKRGGKASSCSGPWRAA